MKATNIFLKYFRWIALWNMNKIKRLYSDRIDVSEGIEVNKVTESKDFDICHYWYFLSYSFKFQPNVCNRCHDL